MPRYGIRRKMFEIPLIPSIADSLCRDELFERTLYYAAFGTKEKQDGVTAFLSPDTSKV